MGRTSDDQQYDFLWSYDYLDKYGISPFHLLKHLGPLHNSPGYVYVIIILRYISDILGGVYHTLTPRFLNIYFLLLIAKYSSEIVWYYTKNKKYKTYTLFSIFLYPVMLFNSAHVFRDTIISFISFIHLKWKDNVPILIVSMTPIIIPPTMAPAIEPNPPKTAAGNAFKPRNPMDVSNRDMRGANKIPLMVATSAEKIQTRP